jgi:tryptophan synthase alpha chain
MVDNRLTSTVRRIRATGRVALCGYFLAGYRTPERFYSAVRAAEALDLLEFGIPSSNPYLDGDLIRGAHRVVVDELGVGTETSLALVGGLKGVVQPRFVMTYAEEGRSMRGFLRLCVEHQIQGVLAPDLSVTEAAEVARHAALLDIAFVGFVHSEMADAEILMRAAHADLVYLKMAEGRTGSPLRLGDRCQRLRDVVALLRATTPHVLIAAGIGIQASSDVMACSDLGVDIVIVGTALMERMNRSMDELAELVGSFRGATLPPGARQHFD